MIPIVCCSLAAPPTTSPPSSPKREAEDRAHDHAPVRAAQRGDLYRWLHRRHEPGTPAAVDEADFDRVDQIRAESDAILIGATTLRRDNPRLLVNSAARRDEREARGLPPYPLKVTVTRSGDLDRDLRFWHHGGDKLIYCPDAAVPELRERLGDLTDVAGLGEALDFSAVLDDLGARGVKRLMVEGGGTIHTQFLTAGLADEIHLAIAPFFLGDPSAPRFVNPGDFPFGPENRMTLAEARTIGDIALLRYLPYRSPQGRLSTNGPSA